MKLLPHARIAFVMLLVSNVAGSGCGEPRRSRGPAPKDPPRSVQADVIRESVHDVRPEAVSVSADEAAGPEIAEKAVVSPATFVRILQPNADAVTSNPVTFAFETGPGISSVALFVDGLPLNYTPLPASARIHTKDFNGVNVVRHLVLEGYGEGGKLLATDEIDFVPSMGFIPPPPGFNQFVVQVINDVMRFPRDGSTPYCWRDCPGTMGLLHDAYYQGELVWGGDGTCFCTGHTLEILLAAIHLWVAHHGLDEAEQFADLTYESLHGGVFYQHWQGYGVTEEASSAIALEAVGAGHFLHPDNWDLALPGDFVNLSRINGTGHAVIFHSWVKDKGEIIGLRYYGCNRSGDSYPDPDQPGNVPGVSGPSFVTELFLEEGGRVLPRYLYVGRPLDPLIGY